MNFFAFASTDYPLGATQAEDLLRRAYGPTSGDVGPHVTICYGEIPDDADVDEVLDAFEAALPRMPIHVVPAGAGQLGDPAEPVDVVFVASDAMSDARRHLLAELAAHGIGCRQTFGDYRPHISVAPTAGDPPDEIAVLGYGVRIGEDLAFYAVGEPFAALSDEDRTPPQAVRETAAGALAARAAAAPAERGMTRVGVARAQDIADGRPLSELTIRRMVAFFDRHPAALDDGPAWQTWAGMGGEAGRAWAADLVGRFSEQALSASQAFAASPIVVEDGRWFRVAGPGPNIDRTTGRARAPLTADDLREMARVDAELRRRGQHQVQVDWLHLSNPDLLRDVTRTPELMAPLGYAVLEYRDDPERGPGLYARIDWNKAGRALVDGRTTPDGRGHLYPSIEFDLRGVYDKRQEPPEKIGRLFVRAIALLGDQQQPGGELDAITALAARGPDTPTDHAGESGTDAGVAGKGAPHMDPMIQAALAGCGLSDEEMGAIMADVAAAENDEGKLTAALMGVKAVGMALAEPEPSDAPEPAAPEPTGGDAPLEAMQAQMAAFAAQLTAAEQKAEAAARQALASRAALSADQRNIVPAQRPMYVQAFIGAHQPEPDPAAVEAFASFGSGANAEPERTTIDERPTGEPSREDKFRNLYGEP